MTSKPVISVLFVCVGNSCRSQMAEGLLRNLGGDRFRAMSAGTHPASRVSPHAVKAMAETGVDISAQRPKSILSLAGERFDWVIPLCDSAEQDCVLFYSEFESTRVLSWPTKDPYESSDSEEELMAAYREVRDELAERIRKWMKELGGNREP
jgi:arsenate reductase